MQSLNLIQVSLGQQLEHHPLSKLRRLYETCCLDQVLSCCDCIILQELFAVGVDLCMGQLLQKSSPPSTDVVEPSTTTTTAAATTSVSLMDPLSEGDSIPPDTMVRFLRLAYSYDQSEVIELLAGRVVHVTESSGDSELIGQGKTLQLIYGMRQLMAANKKCKMAGSGGHGGGSGSGGVAGGMAGQQKDEDKNSE